MFSIIKSRAAGRHARPDTNHSGGRAGLRLAMLVCIGALIATVSPAQTTLLSFSPATGEFTCDETLHVDVMLTDSGDQDLSGFSLVFEFDDEILVPLAVTAGDQLDGAACPNFFTWLNAEAVGDSIKVDAALLGCTTPPDGPIIRIEFGGVALGQSRVTCRNGVMRNGLNEPVVFMSDEGVFEFDCSTPTTRERWGRVKTYYR